MLMGYDQGVKEVTKYVFESMLMWESLEVVRMLMVEGSSRSSCCKWRMRLSWRRVGRSCATCVEV